MISFHAPLELRELPDPSAPAGGVVLDVEATGLCRSDWHAWAGHDDTVTLPHVPGHELVGRICEVGDGVRNWKVGDRVTTSFACGCGTCRWCESGNAQVCPDQQQPGFTHDGSWGEKVMLHGADLNLVAVDEHLPAEAIVPLGCRFATAFRGLRHRARLEAGELMAVIGCGGVGLSAVMIGKALGAEVIAVDVDAGALDQAKRHGAAHTVDTSGLDATQAAQAIIAATGQRPAVTVEALGLEQTMNTALFALAPLGRHVQIGLFAQPPVAAIPRVISDELALLGSHGMSAADYPEMMALVADGSLRPQDLVTRVIGLAEVNEAVAEMDTRTRPGITVIDPRR